MQKIILVFSLVAFLQVFYSCNKYAEISPTKGNATFGFSKKDCCTGGRMDGTTIPTSILFSIEDAGGKEVVKDKKLDLLTFGQRYATEGLQLATGNYKLTKFLVLDASNTIIYASPLEGSDLSHYVNGPLPIDFSITENGSTQVVPQVLAVAAEDKPESFGYVAFGFEVVNITALSIPTFAESIAKVSYEFTNGTQTVKSEGIPLGASLDLNNPALTGKTWQTRILAWPQAMDCYQKVYRYKGELTFNGGILELPAFDKDGWEVFYYVEKEGVHIFRSDPRKSFYVEIQMPEGKAAYAYVDRNFYNDEGNALCDNMYSEISGAGIIEIHIGDPLICEAASGAGLIDSFITINDLTSNSQVQDYFLWEVKNGVIKPSCPTGNSNGRNSGRPGNLRHHN